MPVARIDVIAERKRVIGFQPAVVKVTALGGFTYLQGHDLCLERIAAKLLF